ncbi:MAG: ECF RNA polymerase sigma factor SigK [Micropruina sp.]
MDQVRDESAAAELSQALASALTQCASGDETAFEKVYDMTSAKLYGLTCRVLRDRAQAEEVCQEVYLEIWRRSADFDPARGSALAWMLTIAHRRAVDRVRASAAAARRDQTYQDLNVAPLDDLTATAATDSIEATQVREALGALPAIQREAIQLAYFDGLTHTEVAHRLKLPLGTAKTRIRDGLHRLRSAWGVSHD